jgi:hypothetical protein
MAVAFQKVLSVPDDFDVPKVSMIIHLLYK